MTTDPEQLKAILDEIRARAEELIALFDRFEDGHYRTLAITSIKLAVRWIGQAKLESND